MIIKKKAKVRDMALLIQFKLEAIEPFVDNSNEKLKVISYVNNYIKDNYMKAYLVYDNFKLLGAYLIDDGCLDLLFIKASFQNKGFGTKIIRMLKNDFTYLWVHKDNVRALKFYKKWGLVEKKEKNNRYLLKWS